MDILSHGLWGGLAVGRENKKSFWGAFAFGVFPDVFAFGLPFSHLVFSLLSGGAGEVVTEHASGHPNIPAYTYGLYDISHSLVVFLAIFLLVWAVRRKPLWEMSAWGLHIALDIFTHNDKFFPTPFLWPVSDFYVNGIAWGQPLIFFPNVALLAALYAYWWYVRRKNRVF